MKKLVVIPLFNEEGSVVAVLKELRLYYAGDVLVIDDGSTDSSRQLVEQLGDPHLELISHVINKGYGASLIEGFTYAQGKSYDVVVTMDCDAQHEPHHVAELFSGIASADVLSGSRYLRESSSNDTAPRDRKRINQIITAKLRELTGYDLTDAFCGFKAYRVSALSQLKLSETGYAFPLQFWIQAARHKLKVKEIPVARIYGNLNRSFGAELDDPQKRLLYYERVIDREVAQWKSM